MKNSPICAISTRSSRRKKNIIFDQLRRTRPPDARDRLPVSAAPVHPAHAPEKFSRRRSASRREKRRPLLTYKLSARALSQLVSTKNSDSKAGSILLSRAHQRLFPVPGFLPPTPRLCSFHRKPTAQQRCCRWP